MKKDKLLIPEILIRNGWLKDDKFNEYYGPEAISIQECNNSLYYFGIKVTHVSDLIDILKLNGLKEYANKFKS